MHSSNAAAMVHQQRPPNLPGKSHNQVADRLMTAREAADYRRQGLSTFWRNVKEGLVPKPIYITARSPRWRLSDLCPARQSANINPEN